MTGEVGDAEAAARLGSGRAEIGGFLVSTGLHPAAARERGRGRGALS